MPPDNAARHAGHEFRGASTPSALTARRTLEQAVTTLVATERTLDGASARAFWTVTRTFSNLLDAIAQARTAGCERAEIVRIVAPARARCAASPFVAHAQTWPRGYPGDFEIVEWLMTQDNRAVSGTFGSHIEYLFLSSPPGQQHRNKVAHQARLIDAVLASRCRHPVNVLLIASGAAPDLRAVHPQLVGPEDRFVLNDIDRGALVLAERLLEAIASHCTFVRGNVFRRLGALAELGPFDLVLAGGLFDYLDDEVATGLVQSALTDLVAPGGLLYFSNISTEHPYANMMRFLVDWQLIERDEAAIRALVRDTNVDVTITREPCAVTLLAEVRKHL
jgi:hypothetical protein